MRQTHLLYSIRSFVIYSALSTIACAPDLEISDPIDPNTVTVAQFDPTNPVPILQIIPSPTGLAQNQDGPGLSVDTYPCEGATTKQCLQFVDGWPTTTPITLYFSGPLDPATITDGIRLIAREGPIPTFVDFTVTSSAPRAPPSSPTAPASAPPGAPPQRLAS